MGLDPQPKLILTIVKGPDQNKIFEFTEQDNFLLGRDARGSKAHFRLSPEDKFVSRNHFLLEINPPDCYMRDAGSLNGTFVVRKNGGTILFFLKGREEKQCVDRAKYIAKMFQCESYKEVTERIKLENGDLIKVGDTVIEVRIVQEIPKALQEVKPKEVFSCIRCRKNISSALQGKEVEKLTSDDFLCRECKEKQKRSKKSSPQEAIICSGCHKDLSSEGNRDGRAWELKDIALYWCKNCASSKEEKVPVPRMGGYHILKGLGSGGFGVVYLAWHEKTGRLVAFKLTREKIKRNKQLLDRFKREIGIMKELRHPFLVRLYDEGITEEENYYFVSEYLPEGSLADQLDKRYGGRIPYGEACYFIAQALDGLSYFHNFKEKYVHRDLKPENIFLRKDGKGKLVAKIGDFGLAKSYILHGGTITKEGEWAGTIYYCPPEQIHSFKDVMPSTDVYAMGITLYHLITGEFPYDFPSRKKLLDMISIGEKPRDPIEIILGEDKPIRIEEKLPTLHKGLANAIHKAIEKDVSKRFCSAEEFKNAIERYSS